MIPVPMGGDSSTFRSHHQSYHHLLTTASDMMSVHLSFVLVLLLLLNPAYSRPQFKARIPNGEAHARAGSGLTCERLGHNRCVKGAPRNPFGLDFKAAGLKWTVSLCKKDSDKDGVPNGEELGDPCCKWKPGKMPARKTMLSHPGVKSENGAKFAPPCGKPAVPMKVGKCFGQADRYTAACVCWAVVSGTIKVKGKAVVVTKCRKLFGADRKSRMLQWSCRTFFRSGSGGLLKMKISRSVKVVNKCAK